MLGLFSIISERQSDLIGLRVTATLSFVVASIFVWILSLTGPNLFELFIYLFILSFSSTGTIATGSTPTGLIALSIGLVVGAGEILGGGISPLIAGVIAEIYGIKSILYVSLVGGIAGSIVCLFLMETAPRKVVAKEK